MTDRRINLDDRTRRSALKELAGRVQALSYSDMMELRRYFFNDPRVINIDNFADRFVGVANSILEEGKKN